MNIACPKIWITYFYIYRASQRPRASMCDSQFERHLELDLSEVMGHFSLKLSHWYYLTLMYCSFFLRIFTASSRGITLPTKVHIVKAMVFPVVMYRCESWTIKKAEHQNWCFQIVLLEKTLESPLDCKEIKLVNPKRNQSWIFIGRTDAGAETPIFWQPDMKSWLTGKDPVGKDDGKHWRQKEKGVAQDEMVRQCHWLSAREFEQTLGDSGGQRSLTCYSPWCHKELDTT